jgi:hypothetical protein
MPVKWMDHKGKKILYADYRGLKPEQIDSLARETDAKLAASPMKVLFLTNIEGAVVTTETMLNVKKSAGSVLRDKVEKIAVVGVTGVKKVFFDAFVIALGKTNARSFRTEKEALDWMVE